MERFGVKENVVKSGPVKDILSSTRAMTEEERQILQDVVDGAYDRFVSILHLNDTILIDPVELAARIFSSNRGPAISAVH